MSSKIAFGLLSVLVGLACAPLGNLLRPTATSPALEAPTATLPASASQPLPAATATLRPASTATAAPQLPLQLPSAGLYTFIQPPVGPVERPYVILVAFQDVPDISIEIRGTVNSSEFVCHGSPCAVPVPTSSIVVFRAVTSMGAVSEDNFGTVRVEPGPDGYSIFVDTVNQFGYFSDSCLRYWRFQDDSFPNWAEFVQFPYMLNTDKTLHHLVTRLIVHGVVDVAGCPSGGLNSGLNWPTGCGLERARQTMIEWQNQFDEYIWLASKQIGIPPKILKALIEVESQFWPGNERFYVDEIGLGQVNQLGVDVLLRRDPALYQQVCATVLDDCGKAYHELSDENQAMIRGAYINSQNSICPNCQYGIDLNSAKQSINFIAQVLHANCEMVKLIADDYRPSGYIDDIEDPYSDFWKFTLLSYHSGVGCFETAVDDTPDGVPLDWENLKEYIDCDDGERYVDGVWDSLLSFDAYRYTPSDLEIVQASPVIVPTRTPLPTPVPSTAQVVVQAFLDSNQNGVADGSEGLNNIPVLLRSATGRQVTGTIINGQAILALAEFPIGSEVTVSLPDYYRSERIIVPAQGTVPVTFIFIQPTLPTNIP